MAVYGCRSLSLQPKINKYTNNLGIIGAFRGVYVCYSFPQSKEHVYKQSNYGIPTGGSNTFPHTKKNVYKKNRFIGVLNRV